MSFRARRSIGRPTVVCARACERTTADRSDPARRQPRAAAALRRRLVSARLHRPAVQHRHARRCEGRSRSPATSDGERIGFQGRRYRTRLLAESSYRDAFDDYLGFLAPRLDEAHRAAARRRHAVLPHRLPRGALLQAAARRDLRPRVLPQRAHLGLRLRRARQAPLAGQARHDPRVRQGSRGATSSTPRTSIASRTWRPGS